VAISLVGLLALNACSSDSSPAAPESTSASSGTDAAGSLPPAGSTLPAESTNLGLSEADAASLLATFDPAAAESADLVTYQSDPAVVAAAGDALAVGATGWAKWAATYVWANEGDSVGPLMDLLADSDPAIRLIAAAGVLGRGGIEGFEPLISALDDTSVVGGSEPPIMAWTFATSMLVSLTGEATNGPPFDADDAQRSAAKAKWTDWLAARRATLQFDATSGRWTW
jgi:hypothetical protein